MPLLAIQQYAKTLLLGLPPNTPESNPKFLESARMLGCTRARALAGSRVLASTK
jgi:hypothetical protein